MSDHTHDDLLSLSSDHESDDDLDPGDFVLVDALLPTPEDYKHSPMRETFDEQMRHDQRLLRESLERDHPHNSIEKQWALARMLVFIHFASPEFLLESGDLVPVYGHAPTESLLCHTQRIVISMADPITSSLVIQWLMTGEMDEIKDCTEFFQEKIQEKSLSLDRTGQAAQTYFNRRAGTHDLVSTEASELPVVERKSWLHGACSAASTLNPYCMTNHWGMNIGIGKEGRGTGSHGHLYINVKKLENQYYALQVGLESSAPGKSGPAGQSHGISGRASATAITGGKRLDEYPELQERLGGSLPRRNAMFIRNVKMECFQAIVELFSNLRHPEDCIEMLNLSPYNQHEALTAARVGVHRTQRFDIDWVKRQLGRKSLYKVEIDDAMNQLGLNRDEKNTLNERLQNLFQSHLATCYRKSLNEVIMTLTQEIGEAVNELPNLNEDSAKAKWHLTHLLLEQFKVQHGLAEREEVRIEEAEKDGFCHVNFTGRASSPNFFNGESSESEVSSQSDVSSSGPAFGRDE